MKKKRLRSGYTTGACAAAAAKAACVMLMQGENTKNISIPFPDGSRHEFAVFQASLLDDQNITAATASIIKDAGDDPDVTNGAEIIVTAQLAECNTDHLKKGHFPEIIFSAGEGVGTVTKPGLAIAVGEPAINPVPRKMIRQAVTEAFSNSTPNTYCNGQLTLICSIANGIELATKTLNHRLGIIGGLSILGSTGIVRPVSAEAWTATIQASMSVARETGSEQVVLSTGRTSENAVQKILNLNIEAYAMMGDYLEFSLVESQKKGFKKIHLSGMWAKIMKAAMQIPQTHVRHGALEAKNAARFIADLCDENELASQLDDSNTAREIYERLSAANRTDVIHKVCLAAKEYAQKTSLLPVEVYLVHSSGKVVEHV